MAMEDMETETRKKLKERYHAAAHGMQSGVAMMTHKLNSPVKISEENTYKDLRVGINSAMCSQAAIAQLLMDKGIFTEEEYLEAQAVWMEKERDRYQAEVQEAYGGVNITLG